MNKKRLFFWIKILVILYCGVGIALYYLQDKILFNAETTFQKLKFQGDEFSIDELVNQLKGKTAPPQNIADYVLIKNSLKIIPNILFDFLI